MSGPISSNIHGRTLLHILGQGHAEVCCGLETGDHVDLFAANEAVLDVVLNTLRRMDGLEDVLVGGIELGCFQIGAFVGVFLVLGRTVDNIATQGETLGQLSVHADIGFDVPSDSLLKILRSARIREVGWNSDGVVLIERTRELDEIWENASELGRNGTVRIDAKIWHSVVEKWGHVELATSSRFCLDT